MTSPPCRWILPRKLTLCNESIPLRRLIVATFASELPPAYVIACPECGATGPKQLPGVQVSVASEA